MSLAIEIRRHRVADLRFPARTLDAWEHEHRWRLRLRRIFKTVQDAERRAA